MNIKPMRLMKRPGILLPVFFLSLLPLRGQVDETDAYTAALGGCRAIAPDGFGAGTNPANGSALPGTRFALHHALPYGLPELGALRITAAGPIGRGGLGGGLGTRGMPGLRYMQASLSWGMPLGERLSAGLSLGIMNTAIEGRFFHHPAPGYSLGLAYRHDKAWRFGFLVRQWQNWSPREQRMRFRDSHSSAGVAYTFFRDNTLYTEIHASTLEGIYSSHGLEIRMMDLELLLGLRTHPLSFSTGMTLHRLNWKFCLAFVYRCDQGFVPHFSTVHER